MTFWQHLSRTHSLGVSEKLWRFCLFLWWWTARWMGHENVQRNSSEEMISSLKPSISVPVMGGLWTQMQHTGKKELWLVEFNKGSQQKKSMTSKITEISLYKVSEGSIDMAGGIGQDNSWVSSRLSPYSLDTQKIKVNEEQAVESRWWAHEGGSQLGIVYVTYSAASEATQGKTLITRNHRDAE